MLYFLYFLCINPYPSRFCFYPLKGPEILLLFSSSEALEMKLLSQENSLTGLKRKNSLNQKHEDTNTLLFFPIPHLLHFYSGFYIKHVYLFKVYFFVLII